MRVQYLWIPALLGFLVPSTPWAKTFNMLDVNQVEGTIMVQPADGSNPYALQTGSTVQKGDTLTCYDQSWAILKTHKGDLIGLDGHDGQTTVNVDEYYIEGPDRQIRLVLQKGILMLKTNGCNSRQSFFEINSGAEVTAIGDCQAILTYDPSDEHLNVRYIRGKLSVIDKNNEHQFGIQPVFGSSNNHVEDVRHPTTASDDGENQEYIPEASEYNWKGGVLVDKNPQPMDELDMVNYKRFFNMEDPLEAIGNNILMSDSLAGQILRSTGAGGAQLGDDIKIYNEGVDAYKKRDFGAAKDLWEQFLALHPDNPKVRGSLSKLAQEHPELKIDLSELQYEQHKPSGQSQVK